MERKEFPASVERCVEAYNRYKNIAFLDLLGKSLGLQNDQEILYQDMETTPEG